MNINEPAIWSFVGALSGVLVKGFFDTLIHKSNEKMFYSKIFLQKKAEIILNLLESLETDLGYYFELHKDIEQLNTEFIQLTKTMWSFNLKKTVKKAVLEEFPLLSEKYRKVLNELRQAISSNDNIGKAFKQARLYLNSNIVIKIGIYKNSTNELIKLIDEILKKENIEYDDISKFLLEYLKWTTKFASFFQSLKILTPKDYLFVSDFEKIKINNIDWRFKMFSSFVNKLQLIQEKITTDENKEVQEN